MSDQTTLTPALGTVTLQVEELGRRFILHEQIASGTTAEGREFYVARSIGGVAIMIVVDGGGSYLIDLQPAIGHVFELDAERWEATATARAEGRPS